LCLDISIVPRNKIMPSWEPFLRISKTDGRQGNLLISVVLAMATRDSAYKNVYAEVWAPSTKYLDVKVNKSSTPLVRANANYYAVPWATAYVI